MKPISFGFLILSTLSIIACGGSGGGLTDIASLPKATGSVAATSASSATIKPAATTGTLIKDLQDVDWNDKSRALCEAGSIVKNVLREAGTGDKILCYIGVMERNNLFNASYDGTDKYYTLAPGAGDEDPQTMKVKFNITQSGGQISNFKMWTCEDGSTQSQYLSLTNTNGTVTMTSVNRHSGGGFTFGNRATVNGTVNSSGSWLTKAMTSSIEGTGTYGSESFTHDGYASITQESSTITLSAFQTGTHDDGSTDHTFTSELYGIMEILNPGSLSTFAIGDGSLDFELNFDGTPANGTASWTGDNQGVVTPATSGPYYEDAEAGTPPTAAAQTITFNSADSETWDCAGGTFTDIPSSSFTSAIETQLQACDTQFAGDDHRQHIDCHSGS